MKRLVVILSLVVTGMLLAGGVALAANIQCQESPEGQQPTPCNGTPQNDRILGTDGNDEIRARQGDDFVTGFDGGDRLEGGTGADTLSGNTGEDFIVPFAFSQGVEELKTFDNSDDIVNGGAQNDFLYGGFGQGGRDQVFGGNGDDQIVVSQRVFRADGAETKITRETVDCGPGEQDQVIFDRGFDQIDRETCEILRPVNPDGSFPGQPTARSAAALDFTF